MLTPRTFLFVTCVDRLLFDFFDDDDDDDDAIKL